MKINSPHFDAVLESFLTEAKKYNKKKDMKPAKKAHKKNQKGK